VATDGSVTSSATQNPITAVDIVLETDAMMIQNAQAASAGLLENFSKDSRWATNMHRTCR
jgi:hypothetical protein